MGSELNRRTSVAADLCAAAPCIVVVSQFAKSGYDDQIKERKVRRRAEIEERLKNDSRLKQDHRLDQTRRPSLSDVMADPRPSLTPREHRPPVVAPEDDATAKFKGSSPATNALSTPSKEIPQNTPEKLARPSDAAPQVDIAVRNEDLQRDWWWADEGFIELLGNLDKLEFMTAVDGSDPSMAGFALVVNHWMASAREATVKVVHIHDDKKDYLPPRLRKDRIRADVEALLLSTATPERYSVVFENVAKEHGAKDQILERVPQKGFVAVGYYGAKGKKKHNAPGSTATHVCTNTDACVLVVHEAD